MSRGRLEWERVGLWELSELCDRPDQLDKSDIMRQSLLTGPKLVHFGHVVCDCAAKQEQQAR